MCSKRNSIRRCRIESLTDDFPIALPPPPGDHDYPVWTGTRFRLGTRETAVLSYQQAAPGWTGELTEFHEETAGEHHYIDRASREHAITRLEKWVHTPQPLIMDIGCSSGFLLKAMQSRLPHARLIGADTVIGPLDKLAHTLPGVPLLQFDLLDCPVPDASLDAAVLLNVLEHIEDDRLALQQVFRILKPGGVAVMEVPAGPGLYDVYDKLLRHYRRYRMTELTERASAAGFVVAERSHLGFFLYPAFWAVKKRNRRHLLSDPATQRAVVARSIQTASRNPLFESLMKLEAGLRKLIYLPFGIRCLLVARRPH